MKKKEQRTVCTWCSIFNW